MYVNGNAQTLLGRFIVDNILFVGDMLKCAVFDIKQPYLSLNFHHKGPVTLTKNFI